MRVTRWTAGLAGIAVLALGVSLLVGRLTGVLLDLGLEPGWEWLIEDQPAWFRTILWALTLGPALLLAATVPSTRPGGIGRQLLFLGVIAFLLLGAALHWACALFPPLRVEHIAGPGNGSGVVLLRRGLSPRAYLWLGPGPYDARRPDATAHLPCDGPLELRRSASRPGRWLVVGSESVVGALLELDPGTLTTDRKDLPPVSDLRAEFGADLWLDSPGGGDRPAAHRSRP